MKSLTLDDLKRAFFSDVDFGVFWNVLTYFGNELLITIDLIASRRSKIVVSSGPEEF